MVVQVVPHRHVQQLLARFVRHFSGVVGACGAGAQQGVVPDRPGHRPGVQHRLADGIGLLLLALQLQPVDFALPVFAAGGGGLQAQGGAAFVHLQQLQQRVLQVAFHQVQAFDRARDGHVQRVDVELPQLQRTVVLVFGAAVVQVVVLQVGGADTVANLGVGLALRRDKAVQDDVRVLQPLGLVHREHQRRAKHLARLGLVFVAQHEHGKLRRSPRACVQVALDGVLVGQQAHLALGLRGRLHQVVAFTVDGAKTRVFDFQQAVGHARDGVRVAVVHAQHRQRLALGQRRVAPEQAFDCAPGKKVGVDNLIGVATQHELAGAFERVQHQRKLRIGQVLHLIDDDKVVGRLCQRLPGVCHQVGVKQLVVGQPLAVFAKQVVDGSALLGRKNRLARPQRQIGFAAEHALGLAANDAAKFFKAGVRIGKAVLLLVAGKPAAKVGKAHFAPRRHAQRLQKFAVRQKLCFLIRVVVAVGVVQAAGTLRQPGRLRHVQHLAGCLAQFGQRQRRFARACRSHQDERRALVVNGLLCIVERDGVFEHMKLAPSRVQVAHGLGAGLGFLRGGCGDQRLVHARAAQKARFVVAVVGNDLQHQARRLFAMAHKTHQQAAGVVQLGAVVHRRHKLFQVNAAKVVACDGGAHLVEFAAQLAGRQVCVKKNLHGRRKKVWLLSSLKVAEQGCFT